MKRSSILLTMLSLTLMLAVSFSEATAIEKARPSTEYVVSQDLNSNDITFVSMDAEVLPFVFEAEVTKTRVNHLTASNLIILSGVVVNNHGPPKIRYL